MTRAITVLALLLLTGCGSVGAGGGSGPLPSDVGGLGQDCGQGGHLAERISTDSRSYASGAIITVTLTATNTSSAACAAPFGCFPAVEVDNLAGTAVWRTPRAVRPGAPRSRLLPPVEAAGTPGRVAAGRGAGASGVPGRA